jgi:multicomponent Na+:H+ antiporter subunit G
MMALIGAIITLLGAVFIFLGALGIMRMPDVYNRMQAGTKATTLGSMLSLLGIGLAMPGWLPKLILLIVFIIITNPISSHALARAAHHSGIKLTRKSIRDDFGADFNNNELIDKEAEEE